MKPEDTKAWTLPPKSLVLYRRGEQWRFAVHNEAGVMGGGLGAEFRGASPEAAQAELVRRIVEWTGLTYAVDWTEGEPGWWHANMRIG